MISNIRNKKSQCAIFSSPIFNKQGGKNFPHPSSWKKKIIYISASPTLRYLKI